MELELNMGGFSSFVAVPADVVDKYLATASGIYIKVLLAVLRANRADTAQIARKLTIPESDVKEAVQFWMQNGIFTEAAVSKKQPSEPKPRVVVSAQSLSASEIAGRATGSQEIRFLFQAAESLTGAPISATMQRTLLYVHDSYGLPVDVVLMALEYCWSIGKNNLHYFQKLCAGWADQGINTHALAEETIRRLNSEHSEERQVMEILGLGAYPLTAEQKRYIQVWTRTYGFGPEMVKLACERTINAINKLSLPYMNSILKSWQEKGIRTPADVAAKDGKKAQNPGGSGWTPSYDIEEMERRGLQIPKVEK